MATLLSVGGVASLPTGTLTFLFTDIEGSTRLLHELGPAYDDALTIHRRILRDAFARHDGRELNTEGDAFFVAFERAADAVAASVAFQLDLASHEWPHTPLRVRAGLHTGEARVVDNDLVGMAIHEAARIASAAHGGQILVSSATAETIGDALPQGVSFTDVGRYRLKDIASDVQLLEVSHPSLPVHGRARLSVVRPNNLPPQATSFVGRVAELDELRGLVRPSSVVTIAGPGGSGKTRLALELGHALLDAHPAGVWFVDLASIGDEALIWAALQAVVGVSADNETEARDALFAALANGDAAVVLDNCEHVIEQAAAVCRQLRDACPRISIVATSREAMDVAGEIVYRLPVLDDGAAIDLFVERAQLVSPAYALDEVNRDAVTSICRRLDGLPLAIELAAARIRMLTAAEIDARLADRFRFLTGGPRAATARQQTLRATIDWSYDHLDDGEQLLFRRLSVFPASFSLEALEGVCDYDEALKEHALDLAAALIDRSMLTVVPSPSATRYRLLESMREYGRTELEVSGETDALQATHLAWFERWAAVIPDSGSAHIEAAEPEIDNCRAALRYASSTGDRAAGLRLALALVPYWQRRAMAEGRDWLLAFRSAAPTGSELEMRTLCALGSSSIRLGLDDALPLLRQAAAIDTGDAVWRGEVAAALGTALGGADLEESVALLERAVALFDDAGHLDGRAMALHNLAVQEFNLGKSDEAYARLETAVTAARDAGDDVALASVLGTLAMVDNVFGRLDEARAHVQDVFDIAERINDLDSLARGHAIAAQLASFHGDLHAGAEHNREVLRLYDAASVSPALRNAVCCELGTTLASIGAFDEARAVLRDELAGLGPDRKGLRVRTLGSLSFVEVRAGDTALAVELLDDALALASDGQATDAIEELTLDKVAALCADGKAAEARRTLDALLDEDQQRSRLMAVVLLLSEDDPRAAASTLATWLARAPLATPLSMAYPLELLAHVIGRAGDDDHTGALLVGAVLASYRTLGLAEGAPALVRRRETERVLRARMGDSAFDKTVTRGEAMTIEEAFAAALGALDGLTAPGDGELPGGDLL